MHFKQSEQVSSMQQLHICDLLIAAKTICINNPEHGPSTAIGTAPTVPRYLKRGLAFTWDRRMFYIDDQSFNILLRRFYLII